MKSKTPVATEKQMAFNSHILPHTFLVLFGFLLISFGLWSNEIIFIVFGIILAVVFVAVLLISPTHYIFSEENVVICHPFKRKETICWGRIRSIKIYRGWFYRIGLGYNHYKIYYRHQKACLFLNGEICRTKRTKNLLQKYYKGNVK